MSGRELQCLWRAIQAWAEALGQQRCGVGALSWVRPEIIEGFSIGGRPGHLHVRVHLAEGWPASLLPRRVETPLGEVPLQAWRSARPTAQCATLQGLRNSPSGDAILGALGFLAADKHAADHYYLVTAGHVLAARSGVGFDEPFEIFTTPDGVRIGRAYLAQTSITGGAEVSAYELDAGLLRVSAQVWHSLIREVPAALPQRLGQTPVLGDRLQVCLPGGDVVAGRCQGMSAAMNINTHRVAPDGSTEEVTLRVQSLVAARLDRATQAGDSGASVQDPGGALLGLHCAGLDTDGDEANAWFTPAQAAISYFGILPITRETLGRPLPVTPRPSLRAALPRSVPGTATGAAAGAAPSREVAVDTLARTLWAEARGDGRRGMEAVACVVMNRVHRQTWWGRNVVDVCRKPWQFSCWNPGTPSLERLLKVSPADAAFAQALDIADLAVKADWKDFTDDACHYHTVDILPDWAAGQTPCFRLGRHVFYNRIR